MLSFRVEDMLRTEHVRATFPDCVAVFKFSAKILRNLSPAERCFFPKPRLSALLRVESGLVRVELADAIHVG